MGFGGKRLSLSICLIAGEHFLVPRKCAGLSLDFIELEPSGALLFFRFFFSLSNPPPTSPNSILLSFVRTYLAEISSSSEGARASLKG